ncbi:DUF1772 domain-containing protein [Danxiaibacter flavus]|uniref:DUF1772 domain-containing protein n=1 Tax=Danxiaibacter flavus TaxID=3049108 RepID=A0ABV3ZFM7_9BACT|nr:DUF1772 domain-containing protein [Chitinophagaceae bacterium DXS]
MKKLLNFVTLMLLLLVTGVFWGTWFTLTRSIEEFSISEFIHIGKVIIANVAWPMRILMPSCILFLFLATMSHHQKKSPGFYLSLFSLLLMIATLLITLIVLVPIDNQIKSWIADNPPADWQNIRNRWQFYHQVRTITSVASFGFFTVSFLSASKKSI